MGVAEEFEEVIDASDYTGCRYGKTPENINRT